MSRLRKIIYPFVIMLSFVFGGIGGYMLSNYHHERYLSANAFALKIRAVMLQDGRDLERIKAILNQSIALNPDDYAPYQMLGDIYFDGGRKDLALIMYQAALDNTYKPDAAFYNFSKVKPAEYDRNAIQKKLNMLKDAKQE